MSALNDPSRLRFNNQILHALPESEALRLRPKLTRIRLVTGQILHEAGEHVAYVFFMEQGFTSMVAEANGPEDVVGVGLIGPESIVGLSVLFSDTSVSCSRVTVRSSGVAYRMLTEDLWANLEELPTLRRLLNRTVELSLAQASQTAACNGRHTLKQRLARWLLMAHDRTQGDDVLVTQEILSVMLAVRRSGVTVGLQTLESTGLVRHARGRIRICNRTGLEAAACPCYGRLARFSERVTEAALTQPTKEQISSRLSP